MPIHLISDHHDNIIIRGGRFIYFFDPSMHRNSLSDDSGSSLRISESILSLVFNQMYNDAEFALETPVPACFQFFTYKHHSNLP